jgi:hypothetical protein
MCLTKPKMSSFKAAPQLIPATDNAEARRQADMEALLRRRRAGAAANILTAPGGIPATPRLGEVAR